MIRPPPRSPLSPSPPLSRPGGARARPPAAGPWRERNPWLAFEDGIRTVRGFIQRLESGPGGAVQARLGNDLRAIEEGSATAGVRGPRPPANPAGRGGAAAPPRRGGGGLPRLIPTLPGAPTCPPLPLL